MARLVAVKRVDRFLQVAQLLADRPRARFVVVGDGDLRDRLAASDQARSLGERLIWAGFRRDMADVFFASDVVMLTSDHEGTPVSLIEAQAAAVPVVGTDVGGTRSAVRDGETGVLAAAHDVRGLAEAVAAILDDRELAARMAAAGRRHALSRYTVERLVEDHDRLYDALLKGRAMERSRCRARGPMADQTLLNAEGVVLVVLVVAWVLWALIHKLARTRPDLSIGVPVAVGVGDPAGGDRRDRRDRAELGAARRRRDDVPRAGASSSPTSRWAVGPSPTAHISCTPTSSRCS